MYQTKLGSVIEALVNILIGWWVSFISSLVLFPMVDINVPVTTNLELSVYFTAVSLARSYVIRRWFNARLHRMSLRLAGEEE